MKIKHLIGINIALLSITTINLLKNEEQKYLFDRNTTNRQVKILKNISFKKDSIFYTAPSQNFISTYTTTKDKMISKIFNINEDGTFKQKIEFSIKNLNSIIHYISNDVFLYSNQYQLFHNGNPIDLKNNSFKVFNAYPIEKSSIILLGGLNENKNIKFGFFQYNLLDKKLTLIHQITQSNLSEIPKLQLQYEGKFHKKGNKIAYVNKKSSDVWVFDNWKMNSHFQTKDKTPLPKIIKNGDSFFYDRGKTYNTNMDFYLDNDGVHIFSCRNVNKNQIVVDYYSFDGSYNNSYIIPIEEFSQNLMNVYTQKNLVALAFVNKIIIYTPM